MQTFPFFPFLWWQYLRNCLLCQALCIEFIHVSTSSLLSFIQFYLGSLCALPWVLLPLSRLQWFSSPVFHPPWLPLFPIITLLCIYCLSPLVLCQSICLSSCSLPAPLCLPSLGPQHNIQSSHPPDHDKEHLETISLRLGKRHQLGLGRELIRFWRSKVTETSKNMLLAGTQEFRISPNVCSCNTSRWWIADILDGKGQKSALLQHNDVIWKTLIWPEAGSRGLKGTMFPIQLDPNRFSVCVFSCFYSLILLESNSRTWLTLFFLSFLL